MDKYTREDLVKKAKKYGISTVKKGKTKDNINRTKAELWKDILKAGHEPTPKKSTKKNTKTTSKKSTKKNTKTAPKGEARETRVVTVTYTNVNSDPQLYDTVTIKLDMSVRQWRLLSLKPLTIGTFASEELLSKQEQFGIVVMEIMMDGSVSTFAEFGDLNQELFEDIFNKAEILPNNYEGVGHSIVIRM